MNYKLTSRTYHPLTLLVGAYVLMAIAIVAGASISTMPIVGVLGATALLGAGMAWGAALGNVSTGIEEKRL